MATSRLVDADWRLPPLPLVFTAAVGGMLAAVCDGVYQGIRSRKG
jgi:hypothetical protein